MPELGPHNIAEVYTTILNSRDLTGKFVRVDRRVFWGQSFEHHEDLLFEAGGNAQPNDHGFLGADFYQDIRYLRLSGQSNILSMKGFRLKATERQESAEIIQDIVDKANFPLVID